MMHHIPRVILLLESSRASGRNLLLGIADFARHHGPWSIYWEPRGLEAAWPKLRKLDADGVILRDIEAVEQVVERGIPAVVVGHSKLEYPGLVNVKTEDALVGRMGAAHLRDCGMHHMAFCGFSDKPWSRERAQSFIDAAGPGTSLYERPQAEDHVAWEAERSFIAKWLKSLPKPVGIMACNDDRAEQVIEACKIAGLRIPDEVAVVGADNDDLVCGLADPPISSVHLNFQLAGYESARALHTIMQGGQPVSDLIPVHPSHVVARQSTDFIFLDDPQVVRALRFIRNHGMHSLYVDDVASAAGLSRRVLEKRFRKLLGRSVLSEIRRVRVAQICRLLVETTDSISQIAATLGYEDIQHISRYFHREMKMSPLEYRKRFGRK